MLTKSRHHQHRIINSLAPLIAATVLLGGCTALGPDFVKPEVAEENSLAGGEQGNFQRLTGSGGVVEDLQ